MGYTIEGDGSRRYKLNSRREVVSPANGQDFYVDLVKTRLGRLATMRGRIFHPVDMADDPVRVLSENGWSAPAATYYGVASKMASRGVATGVYDVYTAPTIADFKDPLHSAEQGGLAMIDIMEDITGDSELAIIGHSMGALTGLRNTVTDNRVDYFIGEAPAGIEHRDMWKVYLQNVPDMITDEFSPFLLKSLPRSRFGRQVCYEFMALNATDPTRLMRQVWMLGKDPDLAPMLAKAHERGVLNGVILHSDDKFFHHDKQIQVIGRKPHLFDTVRTVEGTRHLNPNTHADENAAVRIEVVNELRQQKLARRVLAAG